MPDLSKYTKAVYAVLGFVVVVGTAVLQTANVLPAQYTPIVTSVVAGATALLVFFKRNNPAGTPGQDGEGL